MASDDDDDDDAVATASAIATANQEDGDVDLPRRASARRRRHHRPYIPARAVPRALGPGLPACPPRRPAFASFLTIVALSIFVFCQVFLKGRRILVHGVA